MEVFIITDWWIFGATLGAGVLSAVATWIAVVYTNKKATEKYVNDKILQEKANAMVIIKPLVRFNSFFNLSDELVVYNVRDRVLVLSTEKDGFAFFDDFNSYASLNHFLFSIRNDSKNNIQFMKISAVAKIKTKTNAVTAERIENMVKLVRSNEEIIFRMYTSEQREQLWNELGKGNSVELSFDCTIEYLTYAGEQISYKYVTHINNTPQKQIIDDVKQITNDKTISIITDEYTVSDKITLKKDLPSSIFRNMQDKMPIDRITYAQKKVGEAQAAGMMTEFSKLRPSTEVNPMPVSWEGENEQK